jgi:hypothetical protein
LDDELLIVLYPFRLRDPITGKPYLARWKASAEEIVKLGGEICGEPEVRHPVLSGEYFRPYRDSQRVPVPLDNVDVHPLVDDVERFLARSFLRRLTTYYMRRGRYAQAGGAARLWLQLAG